MGEARKTHDNRSKPPATPINADRLDLLLKVTNYNTELRLKLYNGFKKGFDIGFRGIPNSEIVENVQNLSNEKTQAIDDAIRKELENKRISGPFTKIPFNVFQINPISVVAKKSGGYRMITNLSSPAGSSINDGICDVFARVSYASLDTAINLILEAGQNPFLAKSDIKSAFRLIPIDSAQYHLLCFEWKGLYYFDACLPMGARSSCAIFESFSTALEHILSCKGVQLSCHYLDDFLFVGSSERECEKHLSKFREICTYTNVPIAEEKTFGPSQKLEFLGFFIDTIEQSVSLPIDKINKGVEEISELLKLKKCTLKRLQQTLGFLNFTTTVIIPGRAFLVRLYRLTSKVSRPYHKVRLSKSVKEDLKLWLIFLNQYNGKLLYTEQLFKSGNAVEIFTDASKNFGFAAVFGRLWFNGVWPCEWWKSQNIFLLELIPIVLAFFTWGNILANKCVVLWVDNEALVSVLNKQSSTDDQVMFLIRKLVLFSLIHNINFRANHILGKLNVLADSLSRGNLDNFFANSPIAEPLPVKIPQLPSCLSLKQQFSFCI